MPRLTLVDPSTATGATADAFAETRKVLGGTPNLVRAMGNSPALLNMFLAMRGALSKGSLGHKIGEQIALAVGERNECQYCVSAHTMIGKNVGVSADDVQAAREGRASDPRAAAAIAFALAVLNAQGHVADADLAAARAAGLSDGDIAEVIGHVVMNIFTNYTNHVAETPVDFPPVPLLARR